MQRTSQMDDDSFSDSMELFSMATREVNYEREFFYDAIIGYLKYIYFTLNQKDKFKTLFKGAARLFFRKFHDKDELIDPEDNYFSLIYHSITPGLRLEVATALSSIPADLNIATINAVRKVATAFFTPIMLQFEWKNFWNTVVAEQFPTQEAAEVLLVKIQGALLYRLLMSVTDVSKHQNETKNFIEPLPNFNVPQIKLISKVLACEGNNLESLKSIQDELVKTQISDPFTYKNSSTDAEKNTHKSFSDYLTNLSESAKSNLQLTLDNFENALKSTLDKHEFVILAEYGHIALNNHFFEMFKHFSTLPNASKRGIKEFAKIVLRHLNETYGKRNEYEPMLKSTFPLYDELKKIAGKKALHAAKPLIDKINKLNQTGTPILSLADREPSSGQIARTSSSDKAVVLIVKTKEESPRTTKEESPRLIEGFRASKDGLFKKARENSANKLRALLNSDAPLKSQARLEEQTPPRELRNSIAKIPSSSAKESKDLSISPKAENSRTVDTGIAQPVRIAAEAHDLRQSSPRLDLSKRRSMHLTSNLTAAYSPRPTTPQPQRPSVTLKPPTLPGPEESISPRLIDSRHAEEGATHNRRNFQLLAAPLRGAVKNLKASVASEEKPGLVKTS